ncbi:SCO4225 family membrane protein [Streptomyces sp. NPDC001970]
MVLPAGGPDDGGGARGCRGRDRVRVGQGPRARIGTGRVETQAPEAAEQPYSGVRAAGAPPWGHRPRGQPTTNSTGRLSRIARLTFASPASLVYPGPVAVATLLAAYDTLFVHHEDASFARLLPMLLTDTDVLRRRGERRKARRSHGRI